MDIQGVSQSDNLYGWLRVVFAYATGKPFVYCSRYVPSPHGLSESQWERLTERMATAKAGRLLTVVPTHGVAASDRLPTRVGASAAREH